MALNSFRFLFYFAALFAVLLGLEVVKKWAFRKGISRLQILLLLGFSYGLILLADWRFCLCLMLATALTYGVALGIRKGRRKKLFLAVGVTVLVGMLGYFKYTNFFLGGICALLGLSSKTLSIILPLGISFYTFSAIAYLVDVYRGDYEPVTNVLDFALYMAFFPKLVSGPIVRGKVFFPQVQNYRGIQLQPFCQGIQIFMFGLFKKIVLADHLAVFVDNVYFAPGAYHTVTVVLAVVSYALQIYFDFSGYSDMAIGLSKLVGFDFEPNFDLPYGATGFSDFWSRWHISLSSWFRDYLYFPLGGSRKSRVRTCVNLLTVMLVSGLWHGAGITFLLWGLLYGLVSCVEHLLKKPKKAEHRTVARFAGSLGIFAMVTLFWIPFRAADFSNMVAVLQGCFTFQNGIVHPYSWTFVALGCLIIGTAAAAIRSRKQNLSDRKGRPVIRGFYPILDLTTFPGLCIFFIFCGLTVILGYFGNTAFIYGSF